MPPVSLARQIFVRNVPHADNAPKKTRIRAGRGATAEDLNSDLRRRIMRSRTRTDSISLLIVIEGEPPARIGEKHPRRRRVDGTALRGW